MKSQHKKEQRQNNIRTNSKSMMNEIKASEYDVDVNPDLFQTTAY